MDDSIRQEYQQRLDAGDKEGALSYLRMLRTQSDDPSMRASLQQAIDGIEGGGSASASSSTSFGQAQESSGYGQSAGPFGDNPDAWASSHAPRTPTTASADQGGSFGDSGSGYAPAASDAGTAGAAVPAVPAGPPSPATPATPAAPGHPGGLENAGDQIGHFIGERVHQGLSNIGLAPHEQHPAAPAAPAAPKTEHHGLFGLGHKDTPKKDDTGSSV